MKPLTFENYSPGRFLRLCDALKARGIALVNDCGEIKKDGADVLYTYIPGTETLKLTVQSAPWLHNLDDFQDKLQAAVEDQE